MARSFWLFILPLLLLQEPLENVAETICRPGAIDLVFVMDQSGSVGLPDYKIGLEAAAKLADSLDIGLGEQQSRVGFVLFDDTATVEFGLNTYSSNAAVRNAITSLTYSGGGTDIAKGMDAAIKEIFYVMGRKTVPRVVIVITDGYDTSDVKAEHSLAVEAKIRVYAVGVGSDVDKDELIRATGDESLVYTANNYELLSTVMSQICEEIEASVAPPVDPTSAGGSFVHNPKDCGCNTEEDYAKIWLDIIFILDTSNDVASTDIKNYKAILNMMATYYAIGASKDGTAGKYARVAIITNSDKAERFADFSTFKNGADMRKAVAKINTTGGQFNPQWGLQLAQDMIDEEKKANNRPNVKKVVVLFSSIAIDCTNSQKIRTAQNKEQQIDHTVICRLLSTMESEGTIVMPVSVKLPNEEDFPKITVGDECARFRNDASMQGGVMRALCQANCYCLDPYMQFRDDDKCIRYSECFFVHNMALTYDESQYACEDSNEVLSTVKSEKQNKFIQDLHLEAGFFPYWIGMRRSNGNFYYSTGDQVHAVNDYYDWCSGEPDYTKGDCVYLNKCGSGFQTGWFMDKCGMLMPTHYFSCQKDACSVNNYCE